MRRYSLFLALAVVVLSASIGYTYKLRLAKARLMRLQVTPDIKKEYQALASAGWRYQKDDPQSNKPMVRVDARTFEATRDPSTFELQDLALRLFNKTADSYTYVKSAKALFDERSGSLKSRGAVLIVMNVPIDKEAADPSVAKNYVQVQTSAVMYETKSGKASTDESAHFIFPNGSGKSVGAEYDPNTKVLHMKSKVALDWLGTGPPENKMHIETSDLVYKEAEQKVYLTPWAKLQRQTTTIQCQNAVVALQDQRVHQVNGDHAFGTDTREDRQTGYSADKMMALFNEDGVLVNIVGDGNAKVISSQPQARTTLTGSRADMRFNVAPKTVDGVQKSDSTLHLVMADGHAVAQSEPLPGPGVELADTRLLRSEHIELEMKPDGRDLQEIRTPAEAQLEFKPNRPGLPHRIVDASHLRVLYGAGSYVDTFLAWNVVTHTDKPTPPKTTLKNGEPAAPAPALTWSDELTARFKPDSNQVATVEQNGNFRYQEGVRKASSKKAFLDQTTNRMTLLDSARVLDNTGSAVADKIVMDQSSGDMDAEGHVVSTHSPNKNQKPGTSMLDNTQPMQAKADLMQTRDNNTNIHYQGHAVMWQSANRITADVLEINRDGQTLRAKGNVVSELLDNHSNEDASPQEGTQTKGSTPNSGSSSAPIFTTVCAPELFYRDDTRVADYTGGVKLTRARMTITSKELLAYLTPKTPDNTDNSSLDHAFANGDVKVLTVLSENNRTRTANADYGEYWTNEDKVILNGGSPQLVDSFKGITKGRQLTYFNSDDRLLVDGEKKDLAFTKMKIK